MNFTQNILDKTFGILPNNWTIFRIKDLFEIGRGRVIAASEVEKEQTEINNYPVYSAATENNGIIGYINTFDFNQPLLTWTTDGVNAGTVFIRDGKFNCTNVCGTLVAKNKQKNLKFYKYALEAQTPHYKRADINGAKIMNNEMAAILIAEPSSEEDQTKIVTYLDQEISKIDRKILILEQKFDKLEDYKQSVIFETVTTGLDSNVPMRDSGIDWIGDIPAHWEIKRVKDIFHIGRGRVIAVTEVEKEQTELNKYPVYSAATENDGIIGYINKFDFNQPLLTWTTDGAKAGTVFIRNGQFNCTNVCGTLILNSVQYNLKFLKYSLQSQTPYYKRPDTNGAKIMNNEMAAILLFLPNSIEEQEKISKYLDKLSLTIERKKEIIKKQIQLLQEYKQSIIFESVTGKMEIL